MVRRSTWWATAIGTAVGMGGWLLGIGGLMSPAHPGWALFWVTLVATILTQILVEAYIRRKIGREDTAPAASSSRNPQP